MFYNNHTNISSKKISLQPASVRFVISNELGAYLVAVNGTEVVVKPHNNGMPTLATENEALALQNLSSFMVNVRNRPDPCDFLLDFYAMNGWKIEETETEVFQPES
jgi:chorismate synthase